MGERLARRCERYKNTGKGPSPLAYAAGGPFEDLGDRLARPAHPRPDVLATTSSARYALRPPRHGDEAHADAAVDARNPARAIALVEGIEWPAGAVRMVILDEAGAEVHSISVS
jgi:hypothetical protein